MRVVVEVEDKQGGEELDKFLSSSPGVAKVDEYDLGLKLTQDVENIRVLLNEIIDKGVTKNLLLYYLKGKGYSLSEVNNLLNDLNSFLKEIGVRK